MLTQGHSNPFEYLGETCAFPQVPPNYPHRLPNDAFADMSRAIKRILDHEHDEVYRTKEEVKRWLTKVLDDYTTELVEMHVAFMDRRIHFDRALLRSPEPESVGEPVELSDDGTDDDSDDGSDVQPGNNDDDDLVFPDPLRIGVLADGTEVIYYLAPQISDQGGG